ncbi:16S rRNA (cytosine(967)-C(5))-methyltransferase RsmB [Anaerococcus sp. mt242]|uniref:16S rRNA (cytosine(967)-C(5))-methyltransferase RsmB n=1 Tax=Anaerococcus sp. mt242 TaxID=2661917 RepID=UPI001932120B|nr:16S rRNA (cytosine(967)-C(5))-methyltransferase RsmB [Anaerococcus sp. mt242]MBM0045956.1 16S rRNA (cytosine(967)-C(5))-methyltransferase RsmB [Anaerococcus sp. mt242]
MTDLELSFEILDRVINKEAKSNDEINKIADTANNLGFVTKNVYGVLENKIYLDYMIRKLSTIRLKKIHPSVLIILEIGIYNIHFLNTKDYAIVNQLVDLTKQKNKRSAGFVNAILRNFIRDEEKIAKIKESDDIKSLSIRYSLPEELTRYIFNNYGMEYTKNFLRYINSEQTISIRVNNLKTDKDTLKKSLEDKGYKVENGNLSVNALKILNPSGLVNTDEFKNGFFTIQQEGSMKTIEILDPKENSKILDLCAAPGTKTSYIGEYVKNNGEIIANDISEDKLPLIKENIDRLGLENIKLTSFDASILKKEYEDQFDYVLIDAPCSGLGVMGRKPEIRYNRSRDDIKILAELQKEILKNAIKYLKKDGVLVYSTCTIGDIENKENFLYLSSDDNLEIMSIDGKDYIEYVNYIDKTDGFFISKFKKI